jgi:hypothetical protein
VLTQKADEVGRIQGFFLIASMFGVLCLLVAVVTWIWRSQRIHAVWDLGMGPSLPLLPLALPEAKIRHCP